MCILVVTHPYYMHRYVKNSLLLLCHILNFTVTEFAVACQLAVIYALYPQVYVVHGLGICSCVKRKLLLCQV